MSEIIRYEADPATGWRTLTDIPVESFTTDDTAERDRLYFGTDDESVLSGVWECAPSKMTFESYPVHEMMTVLAGSVTITNHDNDSAETFKAGDTFFVSRGSHFTWEITETLRKYYFIVSR